MDVIVVKVFNVRADTSNLNTTIHVKTTLD